MLSKREYHRYDTCSELEKKKAEQGYRRLEEYEDFYLYGKYNKDGVLLYKECFSKFDIDGAMKQVARVLNYGGGKYAGRRTKDISYKKKVHKTNKSRGNDFSIPNQVQA